VAMRTATKSKPAPLERVKQAEVAWLGTRDAATAAGREHSETANRARALEDQRRKVVHQHPELVNHRHEPVDTENPVAKIDAELAKLDVADAELKYRHCQELERVARQRFQDLVRAHGPAVEEARREEGEKLGAEWDAKAAALQDVTDRMHAYAQRSMQLAGIRGIDTHRVAIDPISDVKHTVEGLVASPPPVPRIEEE
jgi:hypothetical protein